MCKLMAVVTRFLFLCAVLLAIPDIAAAQCISKLAVQRVWTRDTGGNDKTTFAPGETIQFAAELNNSYGGALLAANGTQLTITTSFYNDTKPVDIPPGISTWSWNATAPSTEGSYAVTVKAYDHFCGAFIEGGTNFTIGQSSPPPPAAAQPNLHPTEITFDTSTAVVGGTVFFDSGISNTGDVDTGVFNIKWFVDGQEVGAYGSHSGVPANSTVLDGNSQFSWVTTAGTHTITFAVDVDNHVVELDESNNSTSVTVTVAVQADQTRKVIVFLQGVCTSIKKDNTDNRSDTFKDLQALLKHDYGYHDEDFLLYSYLGGFMENDKGVWKWRHSPYNELDPIRQDFRTTSLNALHDQLLTRYYNKYPDTTFILVGHSLGGRVAMEEILQKVGSSDLPPGVLSTVITVDSPLHGMDAIEADIAARIPGLGCVTDGQALGILKDIHNNEPATTEQLKQKVKEAKKQGITVVTVGNIMDCVFNPSACGVPVSGTTDFSTQWLSDSDAITDMWDIPAPCLSSLIKSLTAKCFIETHKAALDKKIASDVLNSIADHIGPQN